MMLFETVNAPVHLVPEDVCGIVQVLGGCIDEFGENICSASGFNFALSSYWGLNIILFVLVLLKIGCCHGFSKRASYSSHAKFVLLCSSGFHLIYLAS